MNNNDRYNKICKAESNFDEYSPDIGQFSQVIWKDTDFIGLGRSTRDKGDLLCTYVVARYSPQATKSGFTENVMKGAFNEDVTCPRKCPSKTSAPTPLAASSKHGKLSNVHPFFQNSALIIIVPQIDYC